MRHLLRLTDYTAEDICRLFSITNDVDHGAYMGALAGKTVVLFFPNSSIRTRVTFEKGVHLLGGQPILFPSDALDKKEDIRDVCGYLNNWADMVIVRHRSIHLLEEMAGYLRVPLINAMTDVNHPCEILSDLYALSRIRKDFRKDHYLFVGRNGNIGLAWREAAQVLGLSLEQCCASGYEIDGLACHHQIMDAVLGKDIICTDSLPSSVVKDFEACRVTSAVMKAANPGALLNPCPPFYRGEEVSAEAIDSPSFVGYEFKKPLLEMQQAIMIDCLRG